MAKRRQGLKRAATGVLLAGSALAAIAWWNSSAHHTKTAVAAPPDSHTQTAVAPPASPSTIAPTTHPTSQPSSTQPSAPSANLTALLMKASAAQNAGNKLDARSLINTALVTGQLTGGGGGDADSAKAYLRELNGSLIFSPDRVEGDPWVDGVTIKSGDNLTRISNSCLVPHLFLMQINHIESDRKIRVNQTIKTLKGPFHGVVDKSHFTLDLYLGSPGGPDSLYVTTFKVGLGAQDSTPTGLWKCMQGNKLKNPTYHSPRGGGIIEADDPQNPLGEYWIGLTGLEGAAVGKTSYGIHGTIEPNSIGTMSSMGCIRLGNEDIAQVFKMLFEGKSLIKVID